MIKKLSLTTVALSALLLTGCGGGGASNDETLQDKLLGTWELTEDNTTGCYNDTDDGTSENIELKIEKNKFILEEKTYSEFECKEGDLSHHQTSTYSYTLGGKVKNSKNKDATEIDVRKTKFTLHKGQSDGTGLDDIGKIDYGMIKLTDGKLRFSDGDRSKLDGSSKEKRSNQFSSNEYWTKNN